ncbi:MAG TPA: hypothetical protein VJK29_18690, partial [Terriglobales bacterium]|nr:hypothetical protein [Terriglobales bacterium]
MSGFLSNPELIRNLRAQLRPGRMVAAAAICAAVSITAGISMFYPYPNTLVFGEKGGMGLLKLTLFFQVAALVIGGGIYCLQAVHREKELNTFDFQRLTRLTPLELAVGKLFGVPAMAYFVVLCFMPAALVGGVKGGVRPSFFLAAFLVLLLGSIVYHAFALLVSLLLEHGSTAAAILLFLLLVWITSVDIQQRSFAVQELSPFFALELVRQHSWYVPSGVNASDVWYSPGDVFFGVPVHHLYVLMGLYLSLTAWFLLAIARNLKRDPAIYELYTPRQVLGLLLYLNVLLLGFFRWRLSPGWWGCRLTPHEAEQLLLGLNAWPFFALGMVLLRNRDRLRRRLRELGDRAAGWKEAMWPASYLLAGTVLVGLAVVGMIHKKRPPESEWNLALALFQVAFFGLWLVRDILYLQWMNLRRGRRPLLLGVLYLIIYYTFMSVLSVVLDFDRRPWRIPYTAIFVPTPLFAKTRFLCMQQRLWILALAMQVIVAAFFIYL